MVCAVFLFSTLPRHASIQGSCNARAYEKLKCQGKLPIAFIACKCAVACSGVCPPDKKLIEGTAAGTVRFNTRMVALATSATVDCFAHFLPAITMLGFKIMHSKITPCLYNCENTLCNALVVAFSHCSIV